MNYNINENGYYGEFGGHTSLKCYTNVENAGQTI